VFVVRNNACLNGWENMAFEMSFLRSDLYGREEFAMFGDLAVSLGI
jgi:hypothetical protein